jgi:hypothetical protein
MICLDIYLCADEPSNMNSGSDALRAHGFTLHQRRYTGIEDSPNDNRVPGPGTYDVIEDVSLSSLSPHPRSASTNLDGVLHDGQRITSPTPRAVTPYEEDLVL